MPPVYRAPEPVFPLESFVRASGLHVGAAAAAASLRRDLVESGAIESAEFDQAYAVARLTPGTNLLALYTLLGKRLGGWRGAALALAAGSLIPAALAGIVAAVYVVYGGEQMAARAMQGARAGALAVLLWAVVRLSRPQLIAHRLRGVILALGTVGAMMLVSIPQIVLLLIAGAIGAAFLAQRMSTWLLYLLLLKATVLSFSGFASVPLGTRRPCHHTRCPVGPTAERCDCDQSGIAGAPRPVRCCRRLFRCGNPRRSCRRVGAGIARASSRADRWCRTAWPSGRNPRCLYVRSSSSPAF